MWTSAHTHRDTLLSVVCEVARNYAELRATRRRRIWRSNLDGSNQQSTQALNRIPAYKGIALDLWGRGQGLSLGDAGPLADCLAGPGVDRATECFTSDFDGDGRIDLFDFALLQRHAGPNR